MEDARSDAFWKHLFSQLTDAVVLVDSQGFITDCNSAACQLTGYSTDELLKPLKLSELCQGMATSHEFTACRNCFATMESTPAFSWRLRDKNGQILCLSASATRLITEIGNSLVVVFRDVTKYQEQEEEYFQRKITRYMMQAQELERKRVSRDLHDGVGQTIYSLIVGLNTLEHAGGILANQQPQFAMTKELAGQALHEVQHIAVDLRPCSLDDWGLTAALRSFAKQFEQTYGIVTELSIKAAEKRYDPAIETALYRIAQEAMLNAAKYANVDQLFLEFQDASEVLKLIIQDDGRGFSLENVTIQGTGLGLYSMQERAELVGGRFVLKTELGKGTTIQVTIPLAEGREKYNDSRIDC